MNREEIRALVRQLSQKHKDDGDGGYALVAVLKQAREGLDPQSQGEFVQLLAEFVRMQDPELWAVALEALVQLGQSEHVSLLATELLESVPDEGRKDYVVLGLLRLSSGNIVEPVLQHIREALRKPRSLTMSMTAALCKVDRELGLDLAADFFVANSGNAAGSDIPGQVAALVRNLVQIQEQLVPELVRRVIVRNPDAGRWLATCIRSYLSQPWMVEDLGGARCRRLSDRIGSSEHTLN
jgi:hypothetical protein